MSDCVLMPAVHFQDICNAVREKSGKQAPLCSGDVAEEIRNLPSGANDAFWDAYQQNGNRVNYYQRFMHDGWNDETFQPKYAITCRDSSTSGCSVFYNARMTTIPVPVIVSGVSAKEMFSQCTKLETISRLVMDNVTETSGMFTGCARLRELNVEGRISTNLSLAAAENLSEESAEKVVLCLRDMSGIGERTLTLHNAVGNRMSPDMKALATIKNWILVY